MKLLLLLAVFITAGAEAQVIDTLSYDRQLLTSFIHPGLLEYQLFKEADGSTVLNGQMTRNVVISNDKKITSTIVFKSQNADTVYSTRISVALGVSLMPVQNTLLASNQKITTLYKADSIMLTLDSINKTRTVTFKPVFLPYDFELDHEMLSSLPLADHFKMAIPFHQPGTKAQPKYYTYEITGSETIIAGEKKYDCWTLISASYLSGFCTWWIRKSDHLIIKEQRVRKDGTKSGMMLKLI